jgi:hypothetical protein
MNGRASVFGALALELSSTGDATTPWLAQHDAGALAGLVARDLARLDPAAATLQLAISGAHCDAVELLRPGWPLHVALEQLAAGAPRHHDSGGRIVAFGAHDGRFPPALTPSAEYAGGPLRLLPFVLSGDAATAAAVGAGFERDLLENGMAGADTALDAQALFGLRVEHARYLTLHDLAAMMALQYEHAGLAALWPILEAALLAPASEEWLDAPPEPLLHFAGGEARMALLSAAAWVARHADPGMDERRLERGFAHYQARQRQFAAVLAAHAVPVLFVHCASAGRDAL